MSAAPKPPPLKARPKRASAGLPPREALERIEAAFRRQPRSRWPLGALGAVWVLSAAYYLLTPPIYLSSFTLILPVSNSGSTVQLESIGQTSTSPSHPFGNVSLSPKVIYKEIIGSDRVRAAAAASVGLKLDELARARVKLVEETSLMQLQMPGGSPEDAQLKAQALLVAFQTQLDTLRRDEFDKRAALVHDNLKLYQANLSTARERIMEFQRATGLLSINQYNEASSTAELIRRKLAEHRSDLQKLSSQQVMLIGRLGLEPTAASAALKLAADAAFSKLASAFADANATFHEDSLRYGPNHPALGIARSKMEGAMGQIRRLAQSANIDPSVDLRKLVMLLNASHQAELMRGMVYSESQIEGKRNEVATLEAELARVEGEIARMSQDAARLEQLKKDHLVAEAVLTSAVARLDTNRTDLYSSYPMVQVLAEPDLPVMRNQPRLSYAILAGIAGSLLILLAWGAAWVREAYARKVPRRA